MKKLIIKIVLTMFITFNILSVSWWYVNIPDKGGAISSISINNSVTTSWNLVSSVNTIWYNILKSVKLIIQALAVLFVVYIWIQMIMSTWTDEEDLSSAKKQIYYTVIGLAFISMPSILFDAFSPTRNTSLTSYNPWASWTTNWDYNIFFNVFSFWYTLNNNVIWFIEVIIAWLAILIMAYTWIKLLTSRWREENISHSKNKIIYSILALLFIWFIESWKAFVFGWRIEDWNTIFSTMFNLALFLVWPTIIFFLTLSAYYYITSNGDEDKVKKAKNIIINVLIASVLLLAAYTFLLDLQGLTQESNFIDTTKK